MAKQAKTAFSHEPTVSHDVNVADRRDRTRDLSAPGDSALADPVDQRRPTWAEGNARMNRIWTPATPQGGNHVTSSGMTMHSADAEVQSDRDCQSERTEQTELSVHVNSIDHD